MTIGGDPLDYAMEHLQGARRFSRYVAAVCPFHDDNKASLLVYPDGYRCLACGARGKLEKLWQTSTISTLALEKPPAQYRPNVPEGWDNERLARSAHHVLSDTPGLQQYLIQRGLGRAIRSFQYGYWDGWYTIPIRDQDDKVQELVFRAGPWIQSATGSRFWQRSGQHARMYCPDWALLRRQELVFVTFGLFDAATLALHHYPAVTSTIGKGSFQPDWLGWFNGYVIIIPDLEEEKEAHLLASKLGWRGRVLLLPYPEGCKDPNDMEQHDPELLVGSIDEYQRNIAASGWVGLTGKV